MFGPRLASVISMSVITVGVGQCGCSVADAMLAHLADEGVPSFFDSVNGLYRPRALLVDSEPKAISQCLRQRRNWNYTPENTQILGQHGAGNNWAAGYSLGATEDVSERFLSAVVRMVERCDSLDGFFFVSSAAGGTGSGLGAGLTEELRDYFMRTSIMNAIVCPFDVGEVVVQHYNACLSFSHLLEVSDGILVIDNELITRACTNLLYLSQPSFSDINSVIAQHLAAALFTSPRCHSFSGSIGMMSSHPSFKFFHSALVPMLPDKSLEFATDSWTALTRRIYQQQFPEKDSLMKSRARAVNKAVACELKLHGKDAAQAIEHVEAVNLFRQRELYPAWSRNPFAVHSREMGYTSQGKHQKAVSLLCNSQSSVRPIERVSSLGYSMFRSRGYVHQYAANGVFEGDFEDAFSSLQQSMSDYRGL